MSVGTNWVLICAEGLGVTRNEFIKFLCRPENWNHGRAQHEQAKPPSPTSLYDGGRDKNRDDDIRRIKDGARKYASDHPKKDAAFIERLEADPAAAGRVNPNRKTRASVSQRPGKSGDVTYTSYIYCIRAERPAIPERLRAEKRLVEEEETFAIQQHLRYGHFFLREEIMRPGSPSKYSINRAEEWFVSANKTTPLFGQSEKRGSWTAIQVGLDWRGGLIHYDFTYDPNNLRSGSQNGDKGLIGVTASPPTHRCINCDNPCFVGQFYLLVSELREGQRLSGPIFVEQIRTMKEDEFRSINPTTELRALIQENREGLMSVVDNI